MNDPQTIDMTFTGLGLQSYPLSPVPCLRCSQGFISTYHALGEPCPLTIGPPPVSLNMANWFSGPGPPNWQIFTPLPDEQLNRLCQKLPKGAVVGVTYTKDGWGAFVSGVDKPCTVDGFPSEMAAKEALVDELMRRAVTRCCGEGVGSDG